MQRTRDRLFELCCLVFFMSTDLGYNNVIVERRVALWLNRIQEGFTQMCSVTIALTVWSGVLMVLELPF